MEKQTKTKAEKRTNFSVRLCSLASVNNIELNLAYGGADLEALSFVFSDDTLEESLSS